MAKWFDQEDKLAKVILDHVNPRSEQKLNVETATNFARFIYATRLQGAEALFFSPAKTQLPDFKEALYSIVELSSNLPMSEKRSLEARMIFHRQSRNEDMDAAPTFEEFDKLLGEMVDAFAYSELVNSPPTRRPKAHGSGDWKKLAVVYATCRIWAEASQVICTKEWETHTRDAPKDPLGQQKIDPSVLGKYFDTFAPKTIGREIPSAFGKFLQDVLDFFYTGSGDAPNASDSLRALRRVQGRRKKKSV